MISTMLYPEWSLSRAEHLNIHLSNQIFKIFNNIKHTDYEAIQGEFYHWHLAQSHKSIDDLFKKFHIGYYKDINLYNKTQLIQVSLTTALFVILLAILVVFYLKYKYTNKLKNKLMKNIQIKEKEIDKLYSRLFLAADTALAGYWEWHLSTDYLYLSKGWKEFLGYNENELKNNYETFISTLHPDDIESTLNIVNNYIKHKKGIYKANFRLKHKDGSYKWVTAIGSMSNSDDNIFFGFHIDIDDLTTTKQTLVAQSKSAMMGEMIGLISHQFKQPLNIISITTSNQLVSLDFEDNIPNKTIRDDANEILKQISYLTETIDTFKNFLKPNNKKSLLCIESVIDSALSIINKNLINNNIKIIKKFSNTKELNIYSDEIIQVFINILNNSKDDFIINDIKNRVITIETSTKNDKIIIDIEDTAGGIDINKIDNIFVST